MGWFVIIVWECELKKSKLDESVNRVETEILLNGERYRKHKEERVALRRQRRLEIKEQRVREERLLAELKKSYKV
jgi:hypothetical protein